MKIVVIAGSGLIGSKLVRKLREQEHEAVAASPDSGVNTLAGEGLAEALKGATVVVDVSNSPSWEDAAVMKFFETSTRNLLAYEAAAYANLLLLFCLSLLPFATSYVLSEKFNSFSVAVYAGELFLSGLAFVVLSASVTRHFHRTGTANPVKLATQKVEGRKGFLSLALYALAVPLAYWHPSIAAADLAFGTLLWIIPGFMLPASRHSERAGSS